MEWNQVYTIIGINVALFGSVSALIVWVVNKLDADIKSVGSDVKSLSSRLDGHAKRIDQLYVMYCESQKENADRFYTLLKEIKK